MKKDDGIQIVDGIETYNGVQIFKGSDLVIGGDLKAWGKPIINSRTYTVDDLERILGSKYYWVLHDAALDFLKAAGGYLGGALVGVGLSAFISFLNGAYKGKVEKYLANIKNNQAKGIYVRQVWECGPIYGYYVQGATTINAVY